MISKINKGEKFVCVNSRPNVHTTVGKVYTSHADGELYTDNNFRVLVDLSDIACQTTFSLDFILYTYAAVSAHYSTLKSMDEADPFAMLLLDLEPTLASEACSCGEHSPNGIYSGKGGLGFVTPEQMKEVDKKINWRDQDLTYAKHTPAANLPPYYDNTNGSLYKIAEQRGWNFYQSDCVKRIDRCLKKGNFKQDIEKTIALLNLWLEETKS